MEPVSGRVAARERWWPSDGKTVRRSHDKVAGKGAIHLVSAWASANTLTLGAGKDGGEVQRNHCHSPAAGTAGLEWMYRNHRRHGLPEGNCSGDSGPGRPTISWQSRRTRGGSTRTSAGTCLRVRRSGGFDGVPHDYATTLNKGHGRIERRECWVISEPACLEYLSTGKDWPGLRSVIKVVGRRETETGPTVHSRYYISSLAGPAEQMLRAGGGHTGALRTRCTGAWMSPSAKTRAGCAKTTVPRTWQRCGR